MITGMALYRLICDQEHSTCSRLLSRLLPSPSWSRRPFLAVLFCLCAILSSAASAPQLEQPQTAVGTKGLPLIRNYTAKEYGAHNRNFDVETGLDGTVFFANFEGLLYYDHAQWRIIHTPDISRVTVVYRAADSTIWVGGYNFFARVARKANGELFIKPVGNTHLFKGEILEIFESNDTLQFLCSDDNIYSVIDNHVRQERHVDYNFKINLKSEVVSTEALKNNKGIFMLDDILQREEVGEDLVVLVKQNKGLIVTDKLGRELYTITEANGLCSNQVTYVAYDGHGLLWGATAHGIFSIELSSPYTYLLPKDGLSGEIHDILSFESHMYVGSSTGLFRLDGNAPRRVADVNGTCWSLCMGPDGMFAATSSGIYVVGKNGSVSRLTQKTTTAILVDGTKIYAGETDGVYLYERGHSEKKVCGLNQVTKMEKLYLRDVNSNKVSIWLQNVFG
ncbi:MAG: hypothetical protein K6G08_09130, partial [Prevotella sp.]|nr:hypothetical protein [Prevotella sp.]